MDTVRGWGGREGRDLFEIEAKLAKALKPVEPSPEFVRDLKRRIITTPDISMSAPAKALYGPIFLIAASVLSGGVLVLMTIKGIRKVKIGGMQPGIKKPKLAEPAQ
jgi:hypothetical protein